MKKPKKAVRRKLKTIPKPNSSKVEKNATKIYFPGRSRELKKDEELLCDESAYLMRHHFDTEYPCLSFDPLSDGLGEKRDTYPMQCYLVAGTQADNVRMNKIIVVKLKNLHKKQPKEENVDEEESEESSDSEDEAEKKPIFCSAQIYHHGGINRIRATTVNELPLCAAWNDQCKVQIWKLGPLLDRVNSLDESVPSNCSNLPDEKPLFSFNGHNCEGYALDWSPISAGKLLSGDNRRNIHLWTMLEGGQWAVDQRPFNSHESSVEDVHWSPNEDNVFASCSSDRTIRLWDSRVTPQQACVCTVDQAHESDVNVISWNSQEPLLVSGGDEGALKIWDLKFIKSGNSVALFKHHTKPITSVHWYKHESTVFAAASADNQVTLWDLSVEPDEMETEQNHDEAKSSRECDVAPQLMFLHSGQEEIKEVRWHPQLCGTLISTALDGFNIFRPVNY